MRIGIGIGIPRFRTGPVAGGGGGSGYDPASDAIFASFTTPPTTGRKTLIDTCVRALKTAGVWAKLDALYAFAAADSQAAKINWIAPGTYNCTEVNAPAFAADAGFTGASTKYLSSGFNGATAPSPKLTQDDASLFAWSSVSSGGSTGGLAGYITSGILRLIPVNAGSFTFNLMNTANDVIANANEVGFFSGSRSAAATTRAYINGVLGSTTGRPSLAVPNENIVFLTRAAIYFTGQIAWGGFGSQLSNAEHTALYNALEAYLTGLAYAAESQAIFAAFTTPPTTARKDVIDTCVKALKSAGVWAKLDALYAFAAADAQAALINWIAPGTYNGTLVNAPAFVADVGFTGASTKYIDSGFNATIAPSPKYVQDSACILGWSNAPAPAPASVSFLGYPVSGNISIGPQLSAGTTASLIINHGSTADTFTVTDGLGLYSAVRTAAAASALYKNGVSIGTSVKVSAALINETFAFFRRQSAYWLGNMAWGGFGSQLNATEQAALYNALNTYLNFETTYSAEATALFAACTVQPPAPRKHHIDMCITALTSAGVWAKLDMFHMFSALDQQQACLNWKNPGTFNCVEMNSPLFTVDQGYTFTPASSHLDPGFNPSTAPSPKFTLNSACAFARGRSSTAINQSMIGNPENSVLFWSRGSASNYFARINQATTNMNASLPPATDLVSINRSGNAASEYYRNGVSVASDATVATGVGTSMWYARSGTGYWALGPMAYGGCGASLNATEQLALFNAVQNFLIAIGSP